VPRRPHLIVGLSGLAGAAVLGGCGFGAVEVDPHEPEPGSAEPCAKLMDELPRTVDDAVRRDIEPASDLAAAWGQPAIVLRCGVPLPEAYRPDAQLHEIDGVAWLTEEVDDGAFFTAVDRDVLVEVAIPDDYAPEADVLAGLAPAIVAAIPS
jgi:hypothetical protein